MTLGLLVAGACYAASPVAPLSPGERPAPGSTEAELWYGMDQAEKEVRQAPILVRDPALNAYAAAVACRVTGDYCRNLRVYLIDAPMFNASMAPNGAMLVFTGTLLRIRDESELALVLGHEFAHFKLRHGLQTWEKAKHTSAFAATLGAMTFGVDGGLVGDFAQLAGTAGMFSFSCDREREADQVGFQAATALGYDPQAGVRIWSRLLREERASRAPKPAPLFASHPKTEERLADVRAAAAAVPASDYHDDPARYLAATRPFLDRWLEQELSRRTYDTTVQMIGDLREGAPDDRAGTLAFYLAEALRHRGKGDDRARASQLYAEAAAHPDAPPAAWREVGLDLREAGKLAEAADALRHYLRLSPQADDRAFVEKYLIDLKATP